MTSPTSAGREPPRPPSTAPPLMRLGGSLPITITSTFRRRASSTIPAPMLRDGHTVSCLDEDPEAHARLEIGLEKPWEDVGGQFTVGTGLEIEALQAAGIERADAFVAATDGDNTNIVIAQIAKMRFKVPTVIARILDPYRAEWYEQQGLHTICPTRVAIEMLETEVKEAAAKVAGG